MKQIKVLLKGKHSCVAMHILHWFLLFFYLTINRSILVLMISVCVALWYHTDFRLDKWGQSNRKWFYQIIFVRLLKFLFLFAKISNVQPSCFPHVKIHFFKQILDENFLGENKLNKQYNLQSWQSIKRKINSINL